MANSDTLDTDTKSKSNGLLSAITRFEFIAKLMFMRALLSRKKVLNRELQSVELDIVSSCNLMKATVTVIKQSMSNESKLAGQVTTSVSMAKQLICREADGDCPLTDE